MTLDWYPGLRALLPILESRGNASADIRHA